MDSGDAGAAALHFEESLRLQPMSAEVLNNYGYFEERRGDQFKALRLYKEARKALLPLVHDQIETNIRNLEDRLAAVEEAAAEA
jgi:Tfp pilus assembly protein PilF